MCWLTDGRTRGRKEEKRGGKKTDRCPSVSLTFALRIKKLRLLPPRNPCGSSLRGGGVYDDICTVMCVHNHLTQNDAWTSLLSSWFVSWWRLTKTSLQDEFSHTAVCFYSPTSLLFFFLIYSGNHVTFICVLETPLSVTLFHTLIHCLFVCLFFFIGLNSSGKCCKPYPRQQPALCSFGPFGDFLLHSDWISTASICSSSSLVVMGNWVLLGSLAGGGVRRSQRQLKENLFFLLFWSTACW